MSLHRDDEAHMYTFSGYANAIFSTNEMWEKVVDNDASEEAMEEVTSKWVELDDYEKHVAFMYLMGQLYQMGQEMKAIFEGDDD